MEKNGDTVRGIKEQLRHGCLTYRQSPGRETLVTRYRDRGNHCVEWPQSARRGRGRRHDRGTAATADHAQRCERRRQAQDESRRESALGGEESEVVAREDPVMPR